MKKFSLVFPALICGLWVTAQSQVPTVTVVATQKTAVFITSSTFYTLPQAPVFPHVQVFHNGLLMLEGTDYTIAGAVITFLAPVDETPIIQVIYFGV